MSARTILNPPLNNVLNNLSDASVGGGVITFTTPPAIPSSGYVSTVFDIPYIIPSGSTTGLAFVFSSFPDAGDSIPLYNYTINSYSSTTGVNITLTFVNTSTTTISTISGVSWVAYSGSVTTVVNT
jgi:hypothetical protein